MNIKKSLNLKSSSIKEIIEIEDVNKKSEEIEEKGDKINKNNDGTNENDEKKDVEKGEKKKGKKHNFYSTLYCCIARTSVFGIHESQT